MNENKKIEVNQIYYATLNKVNGEFDYVIVIPKNNVWINIETGEQYAFKTKEEIETNKDNVPFLFGFTPYSLIIKNAFGEKTVKEILDRDKFISKRMSDKYNEYLYNDTLEFQETLAIIKPDGMKYIDKIINMIYKEGLKIKKYDVRLLDEEILREHYSHIVDKPYYPKLENYMKSSEVVVMVLEGQNAIEKLRELMGPTDSTKADKGTIRGEFGTDITYNAIHGSDCKENAEIEMERFFKFKIKFK